jgi:tetratricopeptide (TPR) repeat protein
MAQSELMGTANTGAPVHMSPAEFLNLGELLQSARQLLRLGQLADARSQFLEVNRRARAQGDVVVAAEAILGYGGLWVHENRTFDARGRFLTLLGEALQTAGEHCPLLAARLSVRLNAELVYVGKGSVASVRAAVESVRSFGDASAEAEALSLLVHLLLAPRNARIRRVACDELIDAAARSNDAYLEAVALMWHTVDLFLTGSPAAERTLSTFRDRAHALDNVALLFIVESLEASLLLRAGDFAAADARAEVALKLGLDAGDPDADAYFGGHLLCSRWMQGRAGELLDVARSLDRNPQVHFMNPAFSGAISVIAALAGERHQASSAIARTRGILELSLVEGISSVHLTTLYSIGEAAGIIGDLDTAHYVREEARSWLALPALASLGIGCFGSMWRVLAVAERTLGQRNESIDAFRHALKANEALGHLPMAAIVRAELAEQLMLSAIEQCGHATFASEADQLFSEAIATAARFSMSIRVAEWSARRDELNQDWKRCSHRSGSRSVEDQGRITRSGRMWRITCAVGSATLADARGLHHLAMLIQAPGQPLSIRQLIGAPAESRHEVIDDAARRQLVETIRRLHDRIDDANLDGDWSRADALRDEVDRITEHAESALWRGRSRAFPDAHERGRPAVQKAIRRVIAQITEQSPELGHALSASIKTGSQCVYIPTAGLPDRWSITTTDA